MSREYGNRDMDVEYEEQYDEYWEESDEEEEDYPVPDDPNAKYPFVHVKLIGEDGNAFAIMGAVKKALQRAGISAEERQKFTDEATSGDYNKLLATCMSWVTVE